MEKVEKKIQSPVKAIRAKCKECTGGFLKEIRLCQQTECPLYHFRMGRNANRKGIGGQFGVRNKE